MKNKFITIAIALIIFVPNLVNAEQAKGLNILINSANAQTQAMAMVISLMSVKQHKKEVNIILCGAAGDLADKNIKGVPIKRPNGKSPSAKQHLKMLIKLGASVKLCPLYLPNSGKDKSILLDGITIAKPPIVAGQLLNSDYKNIAF